MTDDNETRRQIIVDQPGMTSIVTKEYLVIPFTDAVIHKKFFEYWTFLAFVGTSILWAVGLWTDWYQQFGLALAGAFKAQIWLGPVIVLVCVIFFYINRHSVNKLKRKGGASKWKQSQQS